MRKILRILALAIALAAAGFWLATGAHWGWNQSKVPKTIRDEVTDRDVVTYEDRFVAGFEFLGTAGLATGALFIASFLFRKKNLGPADRAGL